MEKAKLIKAPRVVMIGGSAGSLDVIMQIITYLDGKADYALIIILHRRSQQDSPLNDLLAHKTKWEVSEPEDKDPILTRHIYIAPADYHLLIEKDYSFSLDDSEKVNFSRPSIDVSFESAADVYGNKTTAILLSGANADGVEGMLRIKAAGGTCIAQKPDTADVPYMPEQAIKHVAIDHVMDADEIGKLLSAS
jgi:two-component system chemotaxis response regulator CheB